MVASLVFALTAPRPHVELRPTPDRPNQVFSEAPGQATAVWIDGRDTGVRAPEGIRFEATANRRGDVAGTFLLDWSTYSKGQEAYRLVTRNFPFALPWKGRLQWLLLPSRAVNPRVVGLDGRGHVLAIDDPYVTEPRVGGPEGFRRAYLRQGERWLDLGAADAASIEPDGAVRGVYSVDRSGRPVDIAARNVDGTRSVRFVWRSGRRTDLR